MVRAKYSIIRTTPDMVLIEDVGHEDHMTITNDAEAVVQELVKNDWLRPGMKLYYVDSEGDIDEMIVEAGRFRSFKPGPTRNLL